MLTHWSVSEAGLDSVILLSVGAEGGHGYKVHRYKGLQIRGSFRVKAPALGVGGHKRLWVDKGN